MSYQRPEFAGVYDLLSPDRLKEAGLRNALWDIKREDRPRLVADVRETYERDLNWGNLRIMRRRGCRCD